MKKSTFLFFLDNDHYISFQLPRSMNKLLYFDEITISFHKTNQLPIILYTNDNALHAIECLKNVTNDILLSNQELYKNDNHDLGHIWNEILAQKLENFSYIYVENKKMWTGLKYLIWSANAAEKSFFGTSTWLYTKNNKIILLITPDYAWHFDLPSDSSIYLSYDDFIKNYKPLAKIILNQSTIEHLVQLSTDMLTLMEENDRQLQLQYEQLQEERKL